MESAHYHGHRQRLRDRFLKSGFAGFAEHEIVEILLTLCIPCRDVKPAAKALLDRFGSLRAILDAPVSQLQQIRGIGEVAPAALRIIRDTASLYLQQQAKEATTLDSASRLIRNGVETLEAYLHRDATALVCAHNHLNGDVRTSEQDKVLTRALILAANTVQLKLLDHLIISPDKVFSFRKESLM